MIPPPIRRRTRSMLRRLLAPIALTGCAVLTVTLARAANPQPYTIDWVSTGKGAIDGLMQATSQLATLRKSAPVDPFGLIARARGDVTRLQTVLNSFGYYQGTVTITINGMGLDSARLGDALMALPKGTDAHVKIAPTLGPLYHIGRIEIDGALPAALARRAGLPGSLFGLSSGAPAVAADVLAAGTKLQTELEDAGYAFAKVDKPIAHEVPAQHALNLKYAVMTGERVRIGDVRIEGLKHVHESLVRRRLLIHTGEQYDAATVAKARQDLLTLGVFSSVTVHLGTAADAQGRVPVTFIVREAKRFTFGVSAAYSSDLGGSGGISWSDRDVFGGAQQLSIAASAINLGGTASTGIGYDATIGYTIPDFHHRDQSLHLSVTALRQTLQAYSENGQLAGATLSRKLSTVWSITGGVAYEHELIGQPGATCPASLEKNVGGITVCPYSQINDYNLLMLPLSGLYDSTNLASPLADPTHGFRISLNVTPTLSYGRAGALFLVNQASLVTYLDMHKLFQSDPAGHTVIAAKVMAGVAQGATVFSLPPDQRFYAGGSGTVRGYRYQSVGPQFLTNNTPTGIPTGGTTLQVVNLELRQRVGTNFGFVVFADGGGVSQTANPFSGIFRVGVGAGVRYYTPIGPIRFDIAVPTKRYNTDDRFEIYIGLGQAF